MKRPGFREDVLAMALYMGVLFLSALDLTGGTCNTEQVSRCLKAAQSGKLSISSAGKCSLDPYVEFSHSCFVNNYLPTMDHCCCAHEETVLCCRYHQTWNHFRCARGKDTIGTVSASGNVPLYIILPTILGTLVVGAFFVVCCVKRWCFRYDEDHEAQWCGLCDKKTTKKMKQKPNSGNSGQQEPLTSQSQEPRQFDTQDSKDSTARLLPQCSRDDGPVLPSAPPIQDLDGVCMAASGNSDDGSCAYYHRSQSEQQAPGHVFIDAPEYSCSISGPLPPSHGMAPARCPSCSSHVAPPTYDESREHQILP